MEGYQLPSRRDLKHSATCLAPKTRRHAVEVQVSCFNQPPKGCISVGTVRQRAKTIQRYQISLRAHSEDGAGSLSPAVLRCPIEQLINTLNHRAGRIASNKAVQCSKRPPARNPKYRPLVVDSSNQSSSIEVAINSLS